MKKFVFFSVLLTASVFSVSSFACLWDYDTLSSESKNREPILNAIVGNAPKYSPKYYQMRLSRVSNKIARGAPKASLYDDAGVAENHLHHFDEAIVWMQKKQSFLEKQGAKATKDQWYRLFANRGTFHVHKFLSQSNKKDLSSLKRSKSDIEKAITINPDAHFGREWVQLEFIEWLLAYYQASTAQKKHIKTKLFRHGMIEVKARNWNSARPWSNGKKHKSGAQTPKGRSLDETERGLAGLMALGNAERSLDVLATLQLVLQKDGHFQLAYLAYLRQIELVSAGENSLVGNDWIRRKAMPNPTIGNPGPFLSNSTCMTSTWFRAARKVADKNRVARGAYFLKRAEKGEHPDTDAAFWEDFHETKLPSFPTPGRREEAKCKRKNTTLPTFESTN